MLSLYLGSIYEVHLAENGLAGLELARKLLPDLIISDVMMPELNGFELCRALKQDQGPMSLIPVILLTSEKEKAFKLDGLDAGAHDYLTKPFDRQELLVRVKNLITLHTNEKKLGQALKELRRKDQLLQNDIEKAQTFQQKMLPATFQSSELMVEAIYLPLDLVSGDMYDVFEISKSHIRIMILDSTGHGVHAAMKTMVIMSIYEWLKRQLIEPKELIATLNRESYHKYGRMLSFCACCLDLEIGPEGVLVKYANAGLPPLIRISENNAEPIFKESSVLGINDKITIFSHSFTLHPKESLFAYTDGLIDHRNQNNRLFNLRTLVNLMKKQMLETNNLKQLLKRAVESFDTFMNHQLDDDITLIGVESL